ncbi:oligosaccharide flippase family protein [Candidatus Woesebacteria bacterium]|nr:MAG: oligosaccharide flippase family protein [Candidatus Woesebacteria bacterium]
MKKAKDLIRNPLLLGSLLMVGGSLGNNGINYIYHLLMGRVLGPVDYGNLAIIFSILYIVGIIPTSTSFAIVKFISSAKSKSERDHIYFTLKKLLKRFSIIASVVMLLSAYPLKNFLHLGEFYSLIFIAPIVYFMLLTIVNKALLQGILKFTGVVVSDSISSTAKLFLGIVLVFFGLKVPGATFAIVMSSVMAYYYSEIVIKKEISEKSSLDYNIYPIIKFAFPVLLQAMAFTSIFTVDLIIIKHFFGPENPIAGYYAALSMLGKIIFFATQPVASVMFPIVAGKRSKGENYRTTFYLSVSAVFLLSSLVLVFYYLLPDLAIGLLYGKDYLIVAPELVWMGLFITFYTLASLIVNFLLSIHRTQVVMFPLVTSIVQIFVLWNVHSTIREVLYVNTILMGFTLLVLFVYLGYNELKRLNYVKT